MDNCAIYDFETLGTNPQTSPILSAAFLTYDDKRFLAEEELTYDELLGQCYYIKFDVQEQIEKYGRKVQKSTMEWWSRQGDEAKKVLKPSKSDKPFAFLGEALEFYIVDPGDIKKTFTRGNTFDPPFLQYAMEAIGKKDPFNWWTIRDTRSYLDALLIGMNMDNKFLLPEWKEKFVAHDARHDIVVDTLRMQSLVRAIHYEEE